MLLEVEEGQSRCGKTLSPWRLVEEVKVMLLENWQKVFVAGLGKKMHSSCHKA